MNAFQEQQLTRFLERGLPTKREEHWKYTDVSHLKNRSWSKKSAELSDFFQEAASGQMIFVNGRLVSHALPETIQIKTAATQREFDVQRHPFATLNSALLQDDIVLHIPRNTQITQPLHFIFISAHAEHTLACPRVAITVAENSHLTLLEEFYALDAKDYFTNAVTDVYLEQNAELHYAKIQNEAFTATHIATLFVQQKKDSRFKSFHLSQGSHLAREDVMIRSQEEGAECELYGFYCLNEAGQHIDHHLHVDHLAAHGKSTMLYKGILNKKTRAVFNGKVHVHTNAQHIQAHQANHNVLLANDAEINTKPELEIYADNVKCTHGATIGQLDAASLFYLRSRGIDETDARKILTRAFAADVLQPLSESTIKQRIQDVIHLTLANV